VARNIYILSDKKTARVTALRLLAVYFCESNGKKCAVSNDLTKKKNRHKLLHEKKRDHQGTAFAMHFGENRDKRWESGDARA
jgi:hypothetical protein